MQKTTHFSRTEFNHSFRPIDKPDSYVLFSEHMFFNMNNYDQELDDILNVLNDAIIEDTLPSGAHSPEEEVIIQDIIHNHLMNENSEIVPGLRLDHNPGHALVVDALNTAMVTDTSGAEYAAHVTGTDIQVSSLLNEQDFNLMEDQPVLSSMSDTMSAQSTPLALSPNSTMVSTNDISIETNFNSSVNLPQMDNLSISSPPVPTPACDTGMASSVHGYHSPPQNCSQNNEMPQRHRVSSTSGMDCYSGLGFEEVYRPVRSGVSAPHRSPQPYSVRRATDPLPKSLPTFPDAFNRPRTSNSESSSMTSIQTIDGQNYNSFSTNYTQNEFNRANSVPELSQYCPYNRSSVGRPPRLQNQVRTRPLTAREKQNQMDSNVIALEIRKFELTQDLNNLENSVTNIKRELRSRGIYNPSHIPSMRIAPESQSARLNMPSHSGAVNQRQALSVVTTPQFPPNNRPNNMGSNTVSPQYGQGYISPHSWDNLPNK